MQFNDFKSIIRERASIDDENYFKVKKCWEEMISVFSADIDKTILFLDFCTADEFSWLSEIFEEIASRTHSKEFIAALRKTAKKYPKETEIYNISDFIESAECCL